MSLALEERLTAAPFPLKKLIAKKIERSHLDAENIPVQMMETEREIAETKAKLVVLLHPLFT